MKIERLVLMYEITPAQLLYKHTPAQMQISVSRGGMQMKSDPMKLNLDNRQFFDSINIKGIKTQAEDIIRKGKEAALSAAGEYTRQRAAMIGPDAVTLSHMVAQQGRVPAQTQMEFMPSEKPKASWSGGDISMQFIKDKVEISWKPYKMEYTYVPYSVEFFTEER